MLNASAPCRVHFIPVETQRPLTYHKAEFLQHVWSTYCPEGQTLFYADCDIAILRAWEFFEAWVGCGIAVCQDAPHIFVGADHPLRLAWRRILAAEGFTAANRIDRYFNGGFLGVRQEDRSFLELWRRLSDLMERHSGALDRFGSHAVRGQTLGRGRDEFPDDIASLMRPYFAHDQDALNMALMATECDLAPLGADGMGFAPSSLAAMVHAVGAVKPWETKYIRQALRHRVRPGMANEKWWTFADGPIRPLSPRRVSFAKARITVAKMLIGGS
jgi:hypothetical protein